MTVDRLKLMLCFTPRQFMAHDDGRVRLVAPSYLRCSH
jgi:hypothetical protein